MTPPLPPVPHAAMNRSDRPSVFISAVVSLASESPPCRNAALTADERQEIGVDDIRLGRAYAVREAAGAISGSHPLVDIEAHWAYDQSAPPKTGSRMGNIGNRDVSLAIASFPDETAFFQSARP